MCSIPTTVLWTSRILELVVLLWSAQPPIQDAVHPPMDLIGTFLMEVQSNILVLHTTELGLIMDMVVQQYVSIVTLGLPQQESSAVRYLMPVETYRASMWGYMLPPQVSPVHWRETSLYSYQQPVSMNNFLEVSTEDVHKTYLPGRSVITVGWIWDVQRIVIICIGVLPINWFTLLFQETMVIYVT